MDYVRVRPREEERLGVGVGPVHEVRRCAVRIVHLDDLPLAPVCHQMCGLDHNLVPCSRFPHTHLLHHQLRPEGAVRTTPYPMFGSVTVAVVPPVLDEVSVIVPWWARVISRAVDSPRPAP